MNIDAVTFQAIAQSIIFPGGPGLPGAPAPRATALTAGEAAAIVQLADLASDADLDSDSEQRQLRDQLGAHICALAGTSLASIPAAPLPLPDDPEARVAWLEERGRGLFSPAARELAYVTTYLLAIGDLELAPVEIDLLADLQQVFGITDTRAAELVATAAARMTPMAASSGGSDPEPRPA